MFEVSSIKLFNNRRYRVRLARFYNVCKKTPPRDARKLETLSSTGRTRVQGLSAIQRDTECNSKARYKKFSDLAQKNSKYSVLRGAAHFTFR